MRNTNHETRNLFASFPTGVTPVVVLGLMVALSTPAFALGGGGGGSGSAPAPEITKVDDPVAKPGDEVAEVKRLAVGPGDEISDDKTPVGELRTKEPEEKTLAIEDPDEGKAENKPDERVTEFPKPEVVEATVDFATPFSQVIKGARGNLQVVLSNPLPQPLTLTLSEGGSEDGEDKIINFSSDALTFQPGETTKVVSFTVRDTENRYESAIVFLEGNLPAGVTLGTRNFHFITILDTGNRPTTEVDEKPGGGDTQVAVKPDDGTGTDTEDKTIDKLDERTPEVVEAAVYFVTPSSAVPEGRYSILGVRLSKSLPQSLVLSVTGNAGSDDDIIIPDSLTFEPGENRKTLKIETVEDLILEGNETFTFSLGGVLPDGVYFVPGYSTHTVTIHDNDDRAAVGFATPLTYSAVYEGDVKALRINLSNPLLEPLTLDLVESGQGGGNDIEFSSSRLTFQPGEISKTVDVTIVNDEIDEPRESVTVDLVVVDPPDGVTLRWTFSSHTIYISASDPDAATVEFEDATTQIEEGYADVVVSLRGVTSSILEAIHLNYEYTGSAKRGKKYYEKQDGDDQDADYAVLYTRPIVQNTVSYTDRMTAVTVRVFEDAIDEDDETITITISGELPDGVKFGRRTHTITIIDDDDGITSEHVTVGFARPFTDFNEDVGSVAVEVVISEPLDEPLKVSYSRRFPFRPSYEKGGPKRNIYPFSNSLTFQPGETSKSFLFDIADGRRLINASRTASADFTLSGRLPEGVTFGRRKHILIVNDNDTGDGIVEHHWYGTHKDGIYVTEYDGENHISLNNDEHVAKIEAQHLKVEIPHYSGIANISIENSGAVDTDIVARNFIPTSRGLISIKNERSGDVDGNVIGKHHGEGNILIENRGRIGGDMRAVHFKNGDIQIENYGIVGEDMETTHYGNGAISIKNHDYIDGVTIRHFGNGVVRYDGDINKSLNIVGDYEGSNDTQLNFHVDSDGYSRMRVEGNVTNRSRVSLVVDENATVGEDTHFGNLIEVVEGYEAEANSFAGEQTVGAFNYVLEHESEYGHAWSFVNKGLSDTAEQSAKIPDDIEKDMKDPSKTKKGPDGKPELGLWGGLDSSHTDIGLGLPAFVSSDDYYLGSQVQYYLKDDRTGIRALVETEYNFDMMNFRITPHARLTWTRVGFEDFVGPHRERISLVDGDTVDLRLGLSFDNEYQFSNGFASVYGGLFMQTPIDGKTSVKVSGVTIANERNDMVVDGKLGFSYKWDEGYAVYGEATAVHRDDADEVRANLGVRIDF